MRVYRRQHIWSVLYAPVFIAACLFWLPPRPCYAQVSVLTYHNDNARTGQNLNETALTPANVNQSSFGLVFSYAVDGFIVGQPLYLQNVAIPNQGSHNVVYVATLHDSVYAFDADTGALLWQVSFINPAAGITSFPAVNGGCTNVTRFTEQGVIATPAIDPNSGTLYLVAKTFNQGTQSTIQQLHALDVTTGQDKFSGPVMISASFPGTGDGGNTVNFNPTDQMSRTGLLLVGNTVYLSFAGNGCKQIHNHGWVLAYDATTLLPTGVFNTTPNSNNGGIWQAGSGPAVDEEGNIFVETADAVFDANTGGPDFGDSILKLNFGANGLSVADYFTPANQATYNTNDQDLGSVGPLILPDQPGPYPHLLIGSGKDETTYVINRDGMGGYDPVQDQIVQELPPLYTNTRGNVPTYWNGMVYFEQFTTPILAYSVNNGTLSALPVSQTLAGYNRNGPSSISANGTTNGILWVVTAGTTATLRAFDATNLASQLYNSDQAGTRDSLSLPAHFVTPTVANGRVYVGTQTQLVTYGLLGVAPVVTPSPSSLAFGNQNVDTTSPAQMITVTNTGTASLSVNSVTAAGDFAQTNNCSTYIPVQTSCTINVTFTPSMAGLRNGTITIADNAAGSPQTVTLSGTGLAPAVGLSPGSLTFPSQTVGTTSPIQSSTLTNTGTATLSVTSIVPSGDFALATTGTSCPYAGGTVTGGANCTIDVTFTPSATGTRTGTVTVTDNAADSPESVALSGIGLLPSAPAVSLSPGTLTFPSQTVGTTSPIQSSTLTNIGTATLSVASIVPSGDFALATTGTSCPYAGGTVSAGGNCTIDVTFTPSATGTRTGAITITDNAADSPESVALSGIGVLPAAPAVSLSPGSLTFPSQTVGTTSPIHSSILTDTGTGTLSVAGIVPSGDFALATTGTSCPYAGGAVIAGANCTIDVTFTPSVMGTRTGAITITDNASDSPETVNLTGTGAPPLNPAPLISQPLAPSAAAPGGTAFNVTLAGTGFVSGSVVNWNGSPRATTYLSGTRLTAALTASDIASASTASVTVTNSGPGGGTSNGVPLEVTNPTPGVSFGRSDLPAGNGVALVTGDFNGDGKLDLAATNSSGNNVSVLLGNGGGTFQTAVNYNVGNNPHGLVAGDFNGDGKLDLAVADSNDNNVSVLLGNGDGTFQAAVPYAVGHNPNALVVGDFNGNGKLDLAVVNFNDNSISVLLGNGDGTFQAAIPYGVGNNPGAVVTGDFNGDGKLDLAVVNSNDNDISVLLGNGDGTFQAAVPYSVGHDPSALVTGDFNGDGKLDLAAVNSNDNNVSVLLGNGDGTFQAAANYGAAGNPSAVSLADFNGDGKLDLAVANSIGNNLSVLLGNGDGTFQTAVNYGVGNGPDAVVAGDFNNDGRMDLAVTNNADGTISVMLQAPVFSASPSSPAFGNQNLGSSSAPLPVTVTNIGSAILAITSLTMTGSNPGDFSETDNCVGSLAAGASCTVNVTFTPTNVGARAAAVSVTDSAAGSPQAINLSGTGVPVATLQPSNLTFNSQAVGASSPSQSVTLSTNGTLSITSISATAPFNQTNNCGNGLSAPGSCQINVTFTPTAPGVQNGTLTVSDSGAGSPQTVSLSGTGTQPAALLTSTSLNFGNQTVNVASAPQVTTLTNSGNATLTITTVGITGTNPGDFTQTNTCGSSLAAGNSCNITVTFKPPTTGSRSAAVSITDNAPNSPQTVSLSGVGVLPAATFSPTSLTFATQLINTTSPTQPVTLTNTGLGTLTLRGGGFSGAFSGGTTCGPPLAAGASCTINVSFKPKATGTLTGSISITDNAPGSPQTVSLTGTGTEVQLSQTSLNFGSQKVGTTSHGKNVNLTNKGSVPLNISGISITGTNPADFAQANNCGSSVAAGAFCTIRVTFTPQAPGARSANVSINDDGGASPQTIALSGTGT